MIFAAGFGTRMGDLTRATPKPMIPLGGRPMIDHALDLARDAGIARIVANAHYLADQIEAHLAPRGVTVVTEAPRILETGGGLLNARAALGAGPVFTLNPDAAWIGPNPLGLLARAWRPEEMDALLVCVPPEGVRGRSGPGDFGLDATGRITRGGPFVYGGAQILRTDGLSDLGETAFSLNLAWDRMARAGRLFGAVYPGTWCDIGTPEGLRLAERLLEGSDV